MTSDNLQWSWRCSQGLKPEPLFKKRIPIPQCSPTGLLVKMLAMGVCHSDCLILARPSAPPGYNSEFTLGHEGAGEIIEIGPNCNEDFKVGDKVSIHIVPGCGKCRECLAGFRRLCKDPVDSGSYGLGRDGFMQEYVSVRSDACVKVPAGVRIEDAAIAPDAILTSYHAIRYTAQVGPEDTVAILGLGGLGLNGVQIAKYLGVKKVYVLDKRPEAVETAIRLGVEKDNAFCSGDDGYEKRPMQDVLAERGVVVDKVIDFVGHAQTHLAAQMIVKPAGTIVVVGVLSETTPLIPVLMVSKCYDIRGTFAGEIQGLKECLDLIAKGVIKPELSTGSIEDLPQILKDLDDGKVDGRKVLLPDWQS